MLIINSRKRRGENFTTFHLAASKRFNAIKMIAVTPVKSRHVISVPFTFTPALSVEGSPNIFIITILVSVWVCLRSAAFGFFNLM